MENIRPVKNSTDEIEIFIAGVRRVMDENNYEYTQEDEKELRELLTDIYAHEPYRERLKKIQKFFIRLLITRPVAKKVMADFQKGLVL